MGYIDNAVSDELRGLDLRGCDLRGCDLSGADLRGCNMTNVVTDEDGKNDDDDEKRQAWLELEAAVETLSDFARLNDDTSIAMLAYLDDLLDALRLVRKLHHRA